MIGLNVTPTWREGMTFRQVCDAYQGRWAGISDAHLDQDAAAGQAVVLVARNVIVDAVRITSSQRDPDGKVVFTFAQDRALASELVGVAHPVPWRRGAARPVQYLDPDVVHAAAAAHHADPPVPKDRSVTLDGVSLTITADGQVVVTTPIGRDVTVRTRRLR